MRSSHFHRNYLENTPVHLLMSLRILWALSNQEASDIWSSSTSPWSSKLYLGTMSVLLVMRQVNIASWIQGRMSTVLTLVPSVG